MLASPQQHPPQHPGGLGGLGEDANPPALAGDSEGIRITQSRSLLPRTPGETLLFPLTWQGPALEAFH